MPSLTASAASFEPPATATNGTADITAATAGNHPLKKSGSAQTMDSQTGSSVAAPGSNGPETPLNQALQIVEKKVRNLEKRKVRKNVAKNRYSRMKRLRGTKSSHLHVGCRCWKSAKSTK